MIVFVCGEKFNHIWSTYYVSMQSNVFYPLDNYGPFFRDKLQIIAIVVTNGPNMITNGLKYDTIVIIKKTKCECNMMSIEIT